VSTKKAAIDKKSGRVYTVIMERTEVITLLRRKQGDRSLREYAKHVGCSAAYLSDLYRGNRDPGKKIMLFLGLTKRRRVETTYGRA